MSNRRDIHAVIGFSHDMLDRLMNPDLTIEHRQRDKPSQSNHAYHIASY